MNSGIEGWKLFRLHRGEKRVQISSINRGPGKSEQKQVPNLNQLIVCLFSKEQQPGPAVGSHCSPGEFFISLTYVIEPVLPERQQNYVCSLSVVMNHIYSLK